ncbi:hypothetical protein PQX77_018120 [Marasmius sp. AFHP31]|nr:hypothetical protein PQX77_018120 [Marasmius sp. AFHP31]
MIAYYAQSSGGYWQSQDITLPVGEADTTTDVNYQSCVLQQDGQYVRVRDQPFGRTETSTYRHPATATAIFTNVGELQQNDSNEGHANHGNALLLAQPARWHGSSSRWWAEWLLERLWSSNPRTRRCIKTSHYPSHELWVSSSFDA